MKVLFDTNVVVDILTTRQPFFADSVNCYKKLVEQKCKILISTVSIADVMYLTRKHFADFQKQLTAVSDFLAMLGIAKVSKADVHFAFSGVMTDFEDALQAHCAKRYHARYVITRNTKDYALSPVQAVTPTEFMNIQYK